jgi:hypothetical protein
MGGGVTTGGGGDVELVELEDAAFVTPAQETMRHKITLKTVPNKTPLEVVLNWHDCPINLREEPPKNFGLVRDCEFTII